ncbi:MAG: metalloregulator ArsR/SmtB family transcription factor [Acidimicrobiales bacterium]
MDRLIQALRAAGEPTRLRILVMLEGGSELTVTEICRVLGQSQPRVSRHLKLLCDAGLLARQAEGTSAYYRHARSPFARTFLSGLDPLVTDDAAGTITRDEAQLAAIRAERAELAARSFERIALEEEVLRGRAVNQPAVEAAMVALAAEQPIERLLDIGTGTGRVLELFAPHVRAGVGVELSREMLNLARTRLEANHLDHLSVRYGNAYHLDVEMGSVGLAVLHHVLHFLDEPARAVEQAARAVWAGGRLLIVDFAPHHLEALRTEHGHRRLGFTDAEVVHWCTAAGMASVTVSHITLPDPGPDSLTVTVWVATQAADAPVVRNLEVA